MKKILNLTQHPATKDQIDACVFDVSEDYKTKLVSALTFNDLPTVQKIKDSVSELLYIIKNHDAKDVMIGGAPYLMYELHKALKDNNINVHYAFSKRESVEKVNEDGTVTKINVFKHAGFVSF